MFTYSDPTSPTASYTSPPAPAPATYTTSSGPTSPTASYTSPPAPATYTTSPPPPATSAPSTSSPLPPTPLPPAPPNLSVGLIVGIVAGGLLTLVLLGLGYICFRKRKRRREHDPPPLGPKGDDPYDVLPQHGQHNTPQPGSHAVGMPPIPSPPHVVLPQLPHSPVLSPPSLISSSGDYGSNHTGGENPPTPPSPGMALGFSKSKFTYEELAMATDGFSKANLIGQGGFGHVHKGVLPSGKEVAVKQLKEGSVQGEREFQAEVEIISRVHHRHLVTLVGYCITGSHRMLVYEFVPNNTLAFHLHGKGRPNMDWSTRLKIALGAAKGLAYLHEDCHPKIIHRDIKATNILLDSNFEAKVADFGLAKFSPDADTHISTRVMGTFGYLAPEYASSGKLTDKSDVFSFGVMLLELITGRQPYDYSKSSTEDSLVDWARPLLTRALEAGNFDALVDHWLQKDYNHNEMVRMVSCADSCVSHSARHRPRMSQVVRALEGNLSLSDLYAEIRPRHSTAYSFHGGSDYDTNQYCKDLKKFKKVELGTHEYGSSEQSGPTSESGSHPSGSSSSVAQQSTQEMEMGEMKKDD
ncbi:hypothetical protein RHSIM_Rhsim03G0241100 [Rhododendron simsii]|uniref:non-specific serine/threonine protein kinase n=1 Tax=Rhododendron simsii TaxID=118357 RepID=A0A834LT07_RHOSS|nr:hypothetical protein RHSIM_Rhsim03G0241100 [Rhododendron simsii]